MSLTVALREELAHIEDVGTARRLAEARAMVDLAGTLRVRGSDTGPNVSVVVRCAVGAVARRLRGRALRCSSRRVRAAPGRRSASCWMSSRRP